MVTWSTCCLFVLPITWCWWCCVFLLTYLLATPQVMTITWKIHAYQCLKYYIDHGTVIRRLSAYEYATWCTFQPTKKLFSFSEKTYRLNPFCPTDLKIFTTPQCHISHKIINSYSHRLAWKSLRIVVTYNITSSYNLAAKVVVPFKDCQNAAMQAHLMPVGY